MSFDGEGQPAAPTTSDTGDGGGRHEYPIGTSNLGKGSRVTADEIEYATSVSRTSNGYGLAMLKIKGYIILALAERGLDVVVRARKDDLVILTDAEAAPYTDEKFQTRLYQAGLALREQQSVDRAALGVGELARHDRALTVNGATYAGMRQARSEAIKPVPVKRMTPGKL